MKRSMFLLFVGLLACEGSQVDIPPASTGGTERCSLQLGELARVDGIDGRFLIAGASAVAVVAHEPSGDAVWLVPTTGEPPRRIIGQLAPVRSLALVRSHENAARPYDLLVVAGSEVVAVSIALGEKSVLVADAHAPAAAVGFVGSVVWSDVDPAAPASARAVIRMRGLDGGSAVTIATTGGDEPVSSLAIAGGRLAWVSGGGDVETVLLPSVLAPKTALGSAISPDLDVSFDELSFRTTEGLAIRGSGALRAVPVKVEAGYARPSRGSVLGIVNGELVLIRDDTTTSYGAIGGRAGRVGATTGCGVVVAPDRGALLTIRVGH